MILPESVDHLAQRPQESGEDIWNETSQASEEIRQQKTAKPHITVGDASKCIPTVELDLWNTKSICGGSCLGLPDFLDRKTADTLQDLTANRSILQVGPRQQKRLLCYIL